MSPLHVTGDLDAIDARLPETAETALQYLSQCIVSLIVVAVVFPWIIVPLIPVVMLFVYVARWVEELMCALAAVFTPIAAIFLNVRAQVLQEVRA